MDAYNVQGLPMGTVENWQTLLSRSLQSNREKQIQK